MPGGSAWEQQEQDLLQAGFGTCQALLEGNRN